MELDHIFIVGNPGAPEAKVLQEFGLSEGSTNQHAGQGTANRRFFFRNSFIELLYLANSDDASSELTKPTLLHERLTSSSKEVSPFGVCFRPSGPDDESARPDTTAPFPYWSYKPNYLPAHLQVQVGVAPLGEPMWFYLDFATRPDQVQSVSRQPLEHASGFKEITSVRITIPNNADYSEPALSAAKVYGVELVDGDSHLIELFFDKERTKQSFDFRPTLPLIFRW